MLNPVGMTDIKKAHRTETVTVNLDITNLPKNGRFLEASHTAQFGQAQETRYTESF